MIARVHRPSARISTTQAMLVLDDENGEEYAASVFVNEIPKFKK